jgi:hypothetical protein
MTLIRAFLRDTPPSVGVLLAGRSHFFDNPKEMSASLNLSADFSSFNVSEFNEEQVKIYLEKTGWTNPVPAWIPSRPLLLGYLASRGLLQSTLEVDAGSGPAVGWNSLLDRICEREAEIEVGIDPDTVRRLLGHLATIARDSADGLGPLSPDQITNAFTSVCGYPPDDQGMVLLQRLPGLGGHASESGARVFIDKDFAEAARGGAIAEFIENPYGHLLESENWQSTLSGIGADVAAYRCQLAGTTQGKIIAALAQAKSIPRSETLCADVFLTLLHSGMTYDGPDFFLKDVIFPEILLDGLSGDFSHVHLQDCIVGQLELPADLPEERLPEFFRCYFGIVDGRTGTEDMPPRVFRECTIDEFDNPAQTTRAILLLGLPLGTRVVLTMLKKLYAQRGSGRRESAFFRGLDARGKELVPAALGLMRKHGFTIKCRQGDQVIWLPSKPSDLRRRALSILAAPSASRDQLVAESRDLG